MDKRSTWHTKEWQKARDKFLQDECQQCGSSEKLALVHLWRPPRYSTIKIKQQQKKLKELIQLGKVQPFNEQYLRLEEKRNSCPECNSINIQSRKTKLPKYRCGRCFNEFEKGDEVILIDEKEYTKQYKKWMENNLKKYSAEIEQLIQITQEDYNQRYINGEGTTTMCQKCAFLWTQKGMKLCVQCKVKYHKKRYDHCYDCNKVLCEKCESTKLLPQPGGLNICEDCYEKMWEEDFG